MLNRVASSAHACLIHGIQRLLCTSLPGQCSACAQTIDGRSGFGDGLCQPCDAALFPHKIRCIQCGLTLGPRLQAFGWIRCRHCRANTDTSTYTVAATCYLPPVDDLIQQLKYRKEVSLAQLFARKLIDACEQHPQAPALPDVWLPVPCSKERLKQRGYNQALLIARALAKLTGKACKHDWLLKNRHTESQASLSDAARRTNLKDAFALNVSPSRLAGLSIGLVDDVMTTGATLNTLGSILKEHGINNISFWIVARTPE